METIYFPSFSTANPMADPTSLGNMWDLDGMMPCAGDIRGGNVPARVRKLLDDMDDAAVRTESSRRLQRLVDGNGADRFVDVLCERP